jgi:hypothetical protein
MEAVFERHETFIQDYLTKFSAGADLQRQRRFAV